LLAGVHVPFVELLHKAHTGEPLDVPFTQRRVEKAVLSAGSLEAKTGGIAEAGVPSSGMSSYASAASSVSGDTQELMEQNNFCYITLSAIASNDLLQEWAMLMASHH
jgi:hypothetical protein